jgi:hypothetical protein
MLSQGVQLRLHLVPVIVAAPLNYIAFNVGASILFDVRALLKCFCVSARSTALAVDLGVVIAMCLQLRTRTVRRAPGSRAIFMLSTFALQRGVLQMVVQAGEILVVSFLIE